MAVPFKGRFSKSGLTATAGTAFGVLIQPRQNLYTVITTLNFSSGSTQHKYYVMHPWGTTTVASTAAASQAVVNITADPGLTPKGPNGTTSRVAASAIAANDYLVFETPDGSFYYDFVASVSTLAITMTSNLPTGGLAAGAKVWQMKAFGNIDPYTGDANYYFSPTVSVVSNFADTENGLISSHVKYAPILLYNANATAASIANLVEWTYSSIG